MSTMLAIAVPAAVNRPHGAPDSSALASLPASALRNIATPGTRAALRGSVAARVQLQGALEPPELVEDALVLLRELVDLLTLHAQLLIHAAAGASRRPVMPQRCALRARLYGGQALFCVHAAGALYTLGAPYVGPL